MTHREKMRDEWERRGVCLRCGGRKGERLEGRKSCRHCLTRNRKSAIRAQAKKLHGLKRCQRCGGDYNIEDMRGDDCSKCSERGGDVRKRQEEAARDWKIAGWCVECGAPERHGKTDYCFVCLKKETA
jgi:hypothetical protein